MSRQQFATMMQSEVDRIENAGSSKRQELVIEGFTSDAAPRALMGGKEYRIFNSNDYLGLRHHPALKKAEHEATDKYGTGPGAVRFISGTLSIHRELERKIAAFHGRDDAIVFSSAFATNMAVLFCLLKAQNKDSLVTGEALVISDELNHRSIIDGIRVAGMTSEQKAIFKHMDPEDLRRVLSENKGKWQRVIVVTDGVFSMLGEFQDLAKLRAVMDEFDNEFEGGVWMVVDDAHGVGAFGATGRGTEEVTGAKADVLIGTLGKAFGADGGYVTGSQTVIDYLRESAATYIYSNSVTPGTAGAGLAALSLVDSPEGKKMLEHMQTLIAEFKKEMKVAGFEFATDSQHPIQPWFIGDTQRTKQLKLALLQEQVIVTNITYPVVPKGRDEIRVQLCANQQLEDLQAFVAAAKKVW